MGLVLVMPLWRLIWLLVQREMKSTSVLYVIDLVAGTERDEENTSVLYEIDFVRGRRKKKRRGKREV